jgi:Gnt-I system high-affinity gluconate transporter
MPILMLVAGIGLLFILILLRVKPLYALLMVSVAVGVAQGLTPFAAVAAVGSGMVGTLQSLALVLCLGAMLGGLIESSGAARRISETLIHRFGSRNVPWAVMVTGFLVGIPLFYNAGFVILIPLVFSIAAAARIPLLQAGIPMAASLSVTHGFLPPHPGPVAIAAFFGADLGRTMVLGLVLALPIAVIAGPLFARTLKGMVVRSHPAQPERPPERTQEAVPPKVISFLVALLPVMLMAIPAVWELLRPPHPIIRGIGQPEVAMTLAVAAAIVLLGYRQQRTSRQIAQQLWYAIRGILLLLLVIAAGGGFKQVLVESGISAYVQQAAGVFQLSPLVFGWTMAALLRVSIGSATVAGNTAAGIVAPLVAVAGVSPELMVLAVGAGSLMFSHVNDTGFWMFKEYFNLSFRQTFLSWTLMETIVSVLGLAGVLALDHFV